jgi:protein involved in polysaccharide export with SLBB domain
MNNFWLLIIFIINLPTALLGQYTSRNDPSVIKDPTGYKVRSGDVLSIKVDGENECNVNAKISDNGTIEIKYLGRVLVAGQPVDKINSIIADKYKSEQIFAHANVRVSISKYTERMVYLSGSVNRKGPYIFPPEVEAMNIVEVIARAGGFSDIAKKNKVAVTRTFFDETGSSIRTKTYEVDVESLSSPSKSSPSSHWFWIYPGDRINVPERLL